MAIPIDIREEAGVRTLHFGSEWIQGAMRIARPWNLELEYTREMMAPPVLCMDTTHRHPLGGGAWWNEGYWKMLDAIRAAKPSDRMLTTECNGEPFVRWLDGYLTWHWQYDGQVPAFPAVYGGSLAMFGRAYRGGPTEDLALRLKAGQQLVFGEQIGWFHPNVIDKPANAELLRNLVRLRWQLRRYFYAGTMGRPPRLLGDIPKVRADWQWSGEWPVTTDAVLSGAWCLAQDRRAVVLLVNVGEQTITVKADINAAEYGLGEGTIRITASNADG